MDEDLDPVDPTVAATELSRLSRQYGALGQQELEARKAYEQTRAQRLQEAEQRIKAARFGAPSRAEQLFAISSALLAPKPYRGVAGTFAKLAPTLGRLSGAQRTADESREEALLKLRQQYEDKTDGEALAALGTQRAGLLDLMRVYGPLAKPVKARTGFNPITGRLQDMDTGLPVIPPPPKPGEERGDYVYVGGDPASQSSWRKKVM